LFGRRKREVIEKFLGDFQGTLMTDAYNAYAYFNQLDGCTHACCWAHVRRYQQSFVIKSSSKVTTDFQMVA
jgi:hypothetical protein